MTERQLIEACLNHDRRAQHLLYERYCKAMYTIAYRITGDFELAGETLQDAFLLVFRHLANFEGRSTLGAWIKTIVVRTAVRKAERRAPLPDELDLRKDPGHLDWGGSGLDIEYLEKAILTLPDGYRTVFVLAEIEGYTHREIADLLGISEGTSKSQLWGAKKKLQTKLRGMMAGG
ncbi:MAG: RNA polymerase sigma factor [Thermoanaerobaculia bacterium]|nr:RNA polymerase sigma factor [Thermoanaerobaculia bacterium]